ncbi:hypothetical protein ED551_03390 [Muribaculaceae bacterium Isolate-013 (NCI)]|nr:hypothetical protein ED551_03390 [Muribaculaceae bacterium Isolate-013 (NCI)]
MRKLFAILVVALALAVPRASAQVEFKRGLEQVSFIPKGQWITGVSVSFSQSDQKNYQFLIVENLHGDAFTFKVSPMLMYAFQKDMAAGGKFAYTRTRTRLNSADIVLGGDSNFNVDNLYSISQNYSAMAAYRNYFSLGRSRRFGFFNEVQLQVGGGESKIINGSGDDLTGTFERNWNLNVGLAPGMIMFLNNYSAIEVNVGVLGFSYNHTKATTDQIYVASRESKQANFKINLFSITFGVAFYL